MQNKTKYNEGGRQMKEIIEFLVHNPDVLEKVKEGTVSLIGLKGEEVLSILEAFGQNTSNLKAMYWE